MKLRPNHARHCSSVSLGPSRDSAIVGGSVHGFLAGSSLCAARSTQSSAAPKGPRCKLLFKWGAPLRAAAVSRLPAVHGKMPTSSLQACYLLGGPSPQTKCANSLEYEVVLCHCLRCFQRTITAEPSAPMRCLLTIPGCRIGWDALMTSTWSWLTGRARKLSPMRTAHKQKPNAVDRARTTICPISSFESNGYGQN